MVSIIGFHHPESVVEKYRMVCDCRKSLRGFLFRAAREKNIDIKQSWFIGDNVTDIQAGKAAGYWTILIGTMKCELCQLMGERNVFPDKILGNITEAVKEQILAKESVRNLP